MSVRTYKTNLNCGKCVAAVTPHLNGEGRIRRWEVDTRSPDKLLTVEGEAVGPEVVGPLVGAAGFKLLGEIDRPAAPAPHAGHMAPAATGAAEPPVSYRPIVLLFGFLLLGTGLLEAGDGAFVWQRAMSRFMGGFFLAFSFFKLLDMRGFADAYMGYDLLAARWRGWGLAYSFVELALGAAYLAGVWPTVTNAVTLAVMLLGMAGVVRSLLTRRRIRCACLGAVFNLPMSTVTLAEDALMLLMAVVAISVRVH